MKIVVLGAGAMGSLFGGYLSRHNDVWLVDVSETTVGAINANGVKVRERMEARTCSIPRPASTHPRLV